MRRIGLFFSVLALVLLPTAATADTRPLSAAETDRLLHGETIVREQTLTSDDDEDRRWIGGVAYGITRIGRCCAMLSQKTQPGSI